MTMTWEVIAFVAFIAICAAIGDLHHQAKRCAESLVDVEVTLKHIHDSLSGIESDLTDIRSKVASTREPWTGE
jgi:hypothetical protein